MLAIDRLHYRRSGETIIDDLSLELAPGRVACLFGASGCGKTTVLRLIAGLETPDRGHIRHRAERLTYLFQEHRLLPWQNALENVALVSRAGRKSAREAARELLLSLALNANDLGKYPHELSGGMRQRVALARALITDPDLLLMDEPFSALDSNLRRHLQQTICERTLAGNTSVVLVTHDAHEAMRMANDIYFLSSKPARLTATLHLDTPQNARDQHFIAEQERHPLWQRAQTLAWH
ncbi:MAG: ATP-binding cassette domain-containing protein [Cardiobacteriaceae bacterium]|nr:ATP-binding cassette domain-containing protein [Cardiobacteriaceae bacterium]